MQTHLMFAAEKKVDHEFLLASIAMKAVRRMHRDGERTQDTALRVFSILAHGEPVDLPPEAQKGNGFTDPPAAEWFESKGL